MSFTNQLPFVVTEKDCKKSWAGGRDGVYFRCALCGHKFAPGDTARWVFTNDTPGAHGNPMVCVKCDGTRQEVIAKFSLMHKESDGRMWWFCHK